MLTVKMENRTVVVGMLPINLIAHNVKIGTLTITLKMLTVIAMVCILQKECFYPALLQRVSKQLSLAAGCEGDCGATKVD